VSSRIVGSVVALALLFAVGDASAQAPDGGTEANPAPKLIAPKLRRFVDAVAPPALATLGHAEVLLIIDVDETGKVVKVEVTRPAGDGFDEAALAAAQKFEFEPGVFGGKPVPVRITFNYKFAMKVVAPPPPPPDAPPPKPVGVPFAGQVFKKGERLPMGGVSVLLDEGKDFSAITDGDGRFSFDAVPPGKHVVKLRAPTIYSADAPIALTAGKRTDGTYYVLVRQPYTSTVRAARVSVQTVETTLSGDEIRRIPGTQGDTVKAVQNLPGVARSSFNGGQLVVWGSSPNDTRTYVDGVFIPTLFHFGGLRATVNSEIVESLTFRPGGYNVEWGRGMGGTVEINTRKPKDDGVHGFVQLDLIDASLQIEAKLPKKLTLSLGLRRSTIDAWLPAVTPNNFQIVPAYYDYQAKLVWTPNSKTDFEAFFFGSDDQITLRSRQPDPGASGAIDSHIFYHRFLARFNRRFGKGGSFNLVASAGYDVPFQVKVQFGTTPVSIDVRLIPYSLRGTVRVPLTSYLRLDAGIDFEGSNVYADVRGPATGAPQEGDPSATGGGAGQFLTQASTIWVNNTALFAALQFTIFKQRLTIVPQARIDLYSWSGAANSPQAFSKAYFLFEPRLLARLRVTNWMSLTGAVGIYHQAPDLSRLFPGFGNANLTPQYSAAYVLGVEFDPTPTLHIEAQGFYKDLRQLVVRGQTPYEPTYTNDGLGRVYGGELLVRQQLWKGLFGWISYTVLRSERKDHPSDQWRLFQFDQTHILTLIASYKLPKGYQVGIRFRYVTGNPLTPVVGGFFDGNNPQYRPIYGDVYSARLPDFHQLDLRFDKTWTFNKWRLSFYLDIQNLYNNRAPEGLTYNFNFTQTAPLAGLPFVPSLGMRGEF